MAIVVEVEVEAEAEVDEGAAFGMGIPHLEGDGLEVVVCFDVRDDMACCDNLV